MEGFAGVNSIMKFFEETEGDFIEMDLGQEGGGQHFSNGKPGKQGGTDIGQKRQGQPAEDESKFGKREKDQAN